MVRALLCAALVAAVGCGKREEPAGAAPPAPTAAVSLDGPATSAAGEARQIFASRCAGCHGPGGRGDGPTAASLTPAPRNYTDRAWQATVTDDELRRIIVEGGGAVGKSAMMPPAPDLKDKPEVVNELVALIRSFATN